ncbi:MAG: hypothetical protein ACYC96_12035 [Fimbriimonadaceae bacterium]
MPRADLTREIEFLMEGDPVIRWQTMRDLLDAPKTGAIIHELFLDLTFPSHWHYTVLRGLDYVRDTPLIKDHRLDDPLSVIEGRRKPNGRWPVEKRIPGITFFDMEKMGQDSRWNTLRALRVLRSAGRV